MLHKTKLIKLFSYLSLFIFLCIYSHVSASSIKEVKFKGWFDTEFKGNDTSGNRPFFDVHHLYLISEITLEENFSGLFEIEVEHAPRISAGKGNINLDRLYIQKNYLLMSHFVQVNLVHPLDIGFPPTGQY